MYVSQLLVFSFASAKNRSNPNEGVGTKPEVTGTEVLNSDSNLVIAGCTRGTQSKYTTFNSRASAAPARPDAKANAAEACSARRRESGACVRASRIRDIGVSDNTSHLRFST